MSRFLLSLFVIIFCGTTATADTYFHKVPAIKNDNIFTVLQRYYLDDYRCNYEKFYQLNELSSESKLKEGQLYMLPVLIYKYNGKSIRSTLGIKAWDKAIRIRDYNEQILKDKHRKYTVGESSVLWVPFHELNCADDKISDTEKEIAENPDEPATKLVKAPSGERQFPIFGAKHAHVPLKDVSLRGKIYYVVGGHGGPDPGAVGKREGKQLCEDEYAYDVALRLARNLVERGATAYLITRDPDDGIREGKYLPSDQDEYCWGNLKMPWNQKRRLTQRSNAVNELVKKHVSQGIKEKDQVLISIHIDSRSKGDKTDVFFYHFPESAEGEKLAKTMQATLKAKYNKVRPGRNYYGTVTPRDLHMLRETKSNSVYIELGNIRNPNDQQRFIYERNRQLLADWLYDGLIANLKK